METYLPFAVLFFGLIILIAELILLNNSKVIATPNGIHLVGVTLVLVTILFMLTGSIETEFVAPVVGLLGIIVGYVAGTKNADDKNADNK